VFLRVLFDFVDGILGGAVVFFKFRAGHVFSLARFLHFERREVGQLLFSGYSESDFQPLVRIGLALDY